MFDILCLKKLPSNMKVYHGGNRYTLPGLLPIVPKLWLLGLGAIFCGPVSFHDIGPDCCPFVYESRNSSIHCISFHCYIKTVSPSLLPARDVKQQDLLV